VSLKLVGLKDGRLAGSFDDFTIKITNDSSFSNYSNLYGHSNNINALVELNNQILASGSCDKNIIFWNLTSMSKLSTINAQQSKYLKNYYLLK
jgi:WD40 repeat protein